MWLRLGADLDDHVLPLPVNECAGPRAVPLFGRYINTSQYDIKVIMMLSTFITVNNNYLWHVLYLTAQWTAQGQPGCSALGAVRVKGLAQGLKNGNFLGAVARSPMFQSVNHSLNHLSCLMTPPVVTEGEWLLYRSPATLGPQTPVTGGRPKTIFWIVMLLATLLACSSWHLHATIDIQYIWLDCITLLTTYFYTS